jgi:hypothetical protein
VLFRDAFEPGGIWTEPQIKAFGVTVFLKRFQSGWHHFKPVVQIEAFVVWICSSCCSNLLVSALFRISDFVLGIYPHSGS